MKSLHDLGMKHKTDKAYFHKYCDFYDMCLSNIRKSSQNVLEVGINEGASMLMWRDYFENADIYGIDITLQYCKVLNGLDRIHQGIADTSDATTISSLLFTWKNPLFDFIIDDGSHIVSHQKNTIEVLWNSLKPGGIYIIEDLHTNMLANFYDHPHLNPTVINKYLDASETCHDYIIRTMSNRACFSFHKELSQILYFSNVNTGSLTCIFIKEKCLV